MAGELVAAVLDSIDSELLGRFRVAGDEYVVNLGVRRADQEWPADDDGSSEDGVYP